MEPLSQEFYKNIGDVKFMFLEPRDRIRSEIMNSTLRLSTKQDLIKSVSLWSETKAILDDIPDTTLAIKLAFETKHPDDYLKHRFGFTIDDSTFIEFFKIVKLLTTKQICYFYFSMTNQEYVEQFYNYIITLKYEELIQIVNRCGENVLNFICSTRPSLLHVVDERHSPVLTGRNLYRYVIYQLNRDKTLNNRLQLNLDAILHIAKYYPEQAIAAVQKWNFSDTIDLFRMIVQSENIELAHKLFTNLDESKQNQVNRTCFAMYTDFDLNILKDHELRQNIASCKQNQILLERLSTVDKEKLIELILEWHYYNGEDDCRETILLNFFGIFEIRKYCEANFKFASVILRFLTDQNVLTQLSGFEWFWKALATFRAERITQIADIIGNHRLLDNLDVFDYDCVALLFRHYFTDNSEFAFQLFHSYKKKIRVFLSLPDKMNEFLESFSLSTIIEWCDTQYERKDVLEKLPLATAFLMAKELGLTKESPEFSYMHLSRKKALFKRLFN